MDGEITGGKEQVKNTLLLSAVGNVDTGKKFKNQLAASSSLLLYDRERESESLVSSRLVVKAK